MKRLIVPAGLVAAVLAVTILSASSSAKPARERTFTVIERDSEGSFHFVDNPPRAQRPPFAGGRVSAGDEFMVFQPVRSRAGRRLGSLSAVCTAVRGGRNLGKLQSVCHGGYRFKHGTLELEALRSDPGPKIAVTGGTGVYEGASGSVKTVETRGKSVITIHLLP